ncbi:LOB domain-containing protein 22 [Dichanthelium oligosanthes]|uniref:LOB domain-containing protein 22 n=1 Tax=Dichanthelium oligosanthes TaxID=888268 RepID=A0A1E5W2A0_9POAL|nr:LOB domain-containing protein 22 [Dichanthelium oligosanthes]
MSSPPSSKTPPHLRLHVDTTTAATTNGSAASPGSASSSHSSRSPRPSGGGQNQACAACKYQRRKCNADCPLAPYFPADQQRRFLNAHRLFGVSKIQKTLRRIDPERGADAMRTLIFQSEARAADPVGGCVSIIEALQGQIDRTQLELAYVKQQIAIYRQAAATAPLADPTAVVGQDNAVAVDALYAGQEPVPAAAGLVFHDQQGYHALKVVDDQNHPPPQQLYNYLPYNGTTTGDEQYGFANSSVGSLVSLAEKLEQHCQVEAAPLVDAFDIKPQPMPGHQEEKLAAVLKHNVDQHMEEMEEPATAAAAPCHLELGFSS